MAQNMIDPSPRTISEVGFIIFFTYDIFRLDARAVKRIRVCEADFILLVVSKILKILRRNQGLSSVCFEKQFQFKVRFS